MNSRFTLRFTAILLVTLLSLPPAAAQTATTPAEAGADTAPSAEVQRAQTVRRLLAVKQALEAKLEQLRNLVEQLQSADEAERQKITLQIQALRETVAQLTQSFETIAVNGINLRNQENAEQNKLSWRDELLEVARPILESLKEATKKPRRIEELRRTIGQLEQQLDDARKANQSIAQLDISEVPPLVAEGLNKLAAVWRERSQDIERSLELSRSELDELQVQKIDVLGTLNDITREILLGRGLTLLIALLTAILVWLAMRALRHVVKAWRPATPSSDHAAKVRLVLYGYHLLTIALITLSVLSVFYVRGDLLLLSLAIVTLVMLTLGAWRFLPRYVREARLLLNIGVAREGERVIYQGLPFRIARLNLNSELLNPELEGSIRLPLAGLALLNSRPRTDEDWFPSSAGDFLLLPGGDYAQVLQQTIEQVRLKVMGSIVRYASAEFLQLNARNLSREGFGVVVVFGIDYQHQAISLNEVPQRFKSGLLAAFERSDYGEDLQNLVVEFKSAGASSLDYLVYATMNGRSAVSYFAIGRLIQQTCVDICNHEGWVIPFTQVTLHQADAPSPTGAAAPSAQTS